MLFVTKWFGVTSNDAERNPEAERGYAEEIVKKVLVMQADAAARQHRPLCRGTHAKGVTVRAQFEVFDVAAGRDPVLAARLARGIFAKPGVYPAVVRFANSDPHVRSDLKPDVRSLSFSVDLTRNGTETPENSVTRQDFSLQNAATLPINDARAFLATMKVLTARNPIKGLLSLSFRDQLRVIRTLTFAQIQARQSVRPYQHLRYWSTVPFSHGPSDFVKQSAMPSPANPSQPLDKGNPNAQQDELLRHLENDDVMSSFEIGLQLLENERMTYWGQRQDTSFWIENASVEWKETNAPFHAAGRLVFLPRSQLSQRESDAAYFDVTGNTMPDSIPVGSINRARQQSEIASRFERTRAAVDPAAKMPRQCAR
jgi:hypothetical protein